MSIQQKDTKGNMYGFVAHQLQISNDLGCSTTSGSDIISVSDGIEANAWRWEHTPLLCPYLRRLESGAVYIPTKGKSSLAVSSLLLGFYFISRFER